MGDEIPVYNEDLFAPAALREPFEHYRRIRNMGAVVRLREPDVLMLSRFLDVQAALRSPEVLISGQGIGFNATVNTPREHPSTINSDGERHRRLRKGLNRFLMPKPLQEWRAMLREMMGARVRALRERGDWFDAMTGIAQHLPLEAVSHLVGLPDDARTRMLRWAAASFNSFGVPGTGERRRRFEADLEVRFEVQAFLRAVGPGDLKAGSWGERLFQAVEEGRLDLDEARSALAAFVLPSLDTTILAQGNLLYDLALDPDAWRRLRDAPAFVSSAIFESLRHRPVVRWFSRVAVTDYAAGDAHVAAGCRVMLMYGAANRDERHYPQAERFDVARAPMDQLGWGAGPHMCAGMHLARMEMEVLLEALIEHVTQIEIGNPTLVDNQTLFGFDTLPMRLH